MITRRGFIAGLTATTALVAAPGFAATVNHVQWDIARLVQSTLGARQAEIVTEVTHNNALLGELLRRRNEAPLHNAP